jgi:hypothetical protein
MTGSSDSGGGGAVDRPSPTPAPPIVFPFDLVVLRNGGERKLSPDEFFALPLAERIKNVVSGKASFFAEGRAVDAREVLGSMRKQRAKLH